MSFGWSAGDVAAAVKVLYDVYEALDDYHGASHDYREAVAFLKSLTHTLEPLKTLDGYFGSTTCVDEIRREVNLVRGPIEDFLQDIRGLAPKLGQSTKDGLFRHFMPKMKWHFCISKQSLILREKIECHMRILDTLMQRLIIETLVNAQTSLAETCRSMLKDNIRLELLAALDEYCNPRLTDSKSSSQLRDFQVVSPQSHFHSSQIGNLDSNQKESLGDLYYLLLLHLGHFLRDLFGLLSRMAQPTRQLTPVLIAKFHLTFLDAMGSDPRVLQYESFRSFETLQSFIKGEYLSVPLIARKQYLLVDGGGHVLDEKNWTEMARPGSTVMMSAVILSANLSTHSCLRKTCVDVALIQTVKAWKKCPRCATNFFCGDIESTDFRPSFTPDDSSVASQVSSSLQMAFGEEIRPPEVEDDSSFTRVVSLESLLSLRAFDMHDALPPKGQPNHNLFEHSGVVRLGDQMLTIENLSHFNRKHRFSEVVYEWIHTGSTSNRSPTDEQAFRPHLSEKFISCAGKWADVADLDPLSGRTIRL